MFHFFNSERYFTCIYIFLFHLFTCLTVEWSNNYIRLFLIQQDILRYFKCFLHLFFCNVQCQLFKVWSDFDQIIIWIISENSMDYFFIYSAGCFTSYFKSIYNFFYVCVKKKVWNVVAQQSDQIIVLDISGNSMLYNSVRYFAF